MRRGNVIEKMVWCGQERILRIEGYNWKGISWRGEVGSEEGEEEKMKYVREI